MKKRKTIYILGIIILIIIIGIILISSITKKPKQTTKTISNITATVLSYDDNSITLQDSQNIIYTFYTEDVSAEIGSSIILEYTGILDKNTEIQTIEVVNYVPISNTTDNNIPSDWLDNGIFSQYYTLAYNKLKTLSLDEKIGQLFLVRYPDTNAIEDLKTYKFGGYIFFEKDFTNKTETEVKNMIKELQEASTIPLLTAVDEEGGKVVRVSSNNNLVAEKFKSSQELYQTGGFTAIREDTINKSKILSNLGLNLNLAPVVDVSTNSSDYIYERSFGQDTALTSTYAKTVIEASIGTNVSYTLKHFPGYGNNSDTHTGSSIDNRTYDSIVANDLPPFESGINAGAEAVLISHNTVTSIDPDNPASLSASVHNLLRNNLNFTGIIISDNLDMSAITSESEAAITAILAGNDIIITTDYKSSITAVKNAINNGTISENLINKLSFRVLAWKYYKGLMFDNLK